MIKGEQLNLFPFFRVEQKVARVKHNLMKLFVPSGECRHLHVRQTSPALNRPLSSDPEADAGS